MNWIPYNPADAFYKSVPGAVETDRPFRLRLILPRAFGATGAHFLLQRDGEAAAKELDEAGAVVASGVLGGESIVGVIIALASVAAGLAG